MPFSARQGFISSSNVTIDGAFPDFPTLPNKLQYINYLANLSANAATVIEGNVPGNITPFASYGGCIFTMPNGNIAMLPQKPGSVNFDTNEDIGFDIGVYGIFEPSSNTYIFQELARTGASGGFGMDAGAGWVQGTTGYQFYRLSGRYVKEVDFANVNYSAGNIEGVSQYPTNPYFTYPDPPGNPTITVNTVANRYSSDSNWSREKDDGLKLPNGSFLWLPKNANTSLEKWIEGASTTTTAGTYKLTIDQEIFGAATAPNGKVYCAPFKGRNIIVYDYAANTTSTIAVTGPDSDSYANNNVKLFLSASLDKTGNVILGPAHVDYFGHIDTRTDTFSLRYYGNVISSSDKPWLNHGILGPNGNTYFLPGEINTNLPGTAPQDGRKLYEINGSTNTAIELANLEAIANVVAPNEPRFLTMPGASYSDNGKIYAPYGTNFPGTGFPVWQGKTLVINTNANTSLVSSNTQFTFRMSPIGTGTNRGTSISV